MTDFQCFIASGGEARLLMNIHAYAVTERMTESALISRAVDNVAGSLVHPCASNTWSGDGKCRQLRFKNGIVKPAHFIIRTSYDHSARHVRAIAIHTCAKVHCQEALFKYHIARYAMRHGRRAARYCDRIESGAFSAL